MFDAIHQAMIGCSTPSGITARGGHPRPLPVMPNAFRHHGTRRSTARSALTASSHRCAQRLPASRPPTIQIGPGLLTHAKCSTLSGITAPTAPGERAGDLRHVRVLNAFRHHGPRRDVHEKAIILGEVNECSTPSGITARHHARLTPSVSVEDGQPVDVPNAFRHHGPAHDGEWDAHTGTSILCSTPSGITPGSLVDNGIMPVVITCSTPSGIAGPAHPGRRRVQRVLNAFRHHGPRRDRAKPLRRPEPVLNAFRHHGPRRTNSKPLRYPKREKCSTPSGITDRDGIDSADGKNTEVDLHVLNAFRHHGPLRSLPLPPPSLRHA